MAKVNTIIVSHFDTDHYRGLMMLAEGMKARNIQFEQLTLIAPRPPTVPEDPWGYSTRYLALVGAVTGLPHLDLAKALAEVTAPGRFLYQSTGRGEWFTAARQQFLVHWPPSRLPADVAGKVRRAMEKYDELTEKMEQRGDPTLKDNLEKARGGWWLALGVTDAVQGSQDLTEFRKRRSLPDHDGRPLEVRELGEEADDGMEMPKIKGLEVPEDLIEDWKTAWDAFRRANNDMSLVCEEPRASSMVAFGDASAPVLSWLMKRRELRRWYGVMLAPHHGSQKLPPNFYLRSDICISQNGKRLWPHWTSGHSLLPRHSAFCVSTKGGNQNVLLPRWPWC
ncbi:MAG TPA: hypothetical protein VMV09_08160 [Candidatus Saccharimonadales bacterium]|nr:hypothetical protein [Candidatus Saccharimonadales bacterium]